MAWNPGPEVATVRDAARRLSEIRKSKVRQCIVVYTTEAGQLGVASYGETKAECAEAGRLADKLYDRAMKFFRDSTPDDDEVFGTQLFQ